MVEVARINDAAYGFDGDFERALRKLPPDPAHLYLARSDGVAACALLSYERRANLRIYLVATRPERAAGTGYGADAARARGGA